MSHEHEHFDEEFPILVLVDEEGEEHEFELLAGIGNRRRYLPCS